MKMSKNIALPTLMPGVGPVCKSFFKAVFYFLTQIVIDLDPKNGPPPKKKCERNDE